MTAEVDLLPLLLDEDGGFRVPVWVYEKAMSDPRTKEAIAILRSLATQHQEPKR